MIDKEKIVEAIYERAEGLQSIEIDGLISFKWMRDIVLHNYVRLFIYKPSTPEIEVYVYGYSNLKKIITEEIDKAEKADKETMNEHSQNSNTTNDEIDKNNDKIKELKTRIKELKKENKELKKETNKVKGRFRAQENGLYFFVHLYGTVDKDWDCSIYDDKRFEKGNFFETEELAKKSLIYFALNDPYEYWLPWMGEDTRPSEVPDGLQCYSDNCWYGSWAEPEYWMNQCYRWPKHPNTKV
jgi:hypothetical protein